MKFKNRLLILLLFACATVRAVNGDPATVHKKYRVLYFYDYGTPAYEPDYNSACTVLLAKKYGFKRTLKGGCSISFLQANRWERHNLRVERKLTKRFGSDWHQLYANDYIACKHEQK